MSQNSDLPTPRTATARAHVSSERLRQLAKWGDQSHTDMEWLVILVEEVGEVARSIFENGEADYDEITQCSAVALAWMEDRIRDSAIINV